MMHGQQNVKILTSVTFMLTAVLAYLEELCQCTERTVCSDIWHYGWVTRGKERESSNSRWVYTIPRPGPR